MLIGLGIELAKALNWVVYRVLIHAHFLHVELMHMLLQGQNALMAACNRTRGGYAIEKYWDQTTSGDLLALPWLALPMKALSMVRTKTSCPSNLKGRL